MLYAVVVLYYTLPCRSQCRTMAQVPAAIECKCIRRCEQVACITFDLDVHWSACLFSCLKACLSACLPDCLPACLPACLPVSLSACLSTACLSATACGSTRQPPHLALFKWPLQATPLGRWSLCCASARKVPPVVDCWAARATFTRRAWHVSRGSGWQRRQGGTPCTWSPLPPCH